MAHYISKDALVAEVERQIKLFGSKNYKCSDRLTVEERLFTLNSIKKFIETLEVKEIDLEKIIEEYFKGWTDDYDNGGAACHYQYVQVNDCKAIAKHFFELGLNVQKGE